MTGARCAHVRRLLPLFVGADLGKSQMAEVRRHLCECGSCRRAGADLQQAHKALRALGAAGGAVAGSESEEDRFASLHAAIMTRVEAIAEPDLTAAARGALARRVLVLAAAVLLGALGVWLAGFGRGSSVWDRPATAVPSDGLRAVPWSGPRLQLRPVWFGPPAGGSAENGFGPGMMGRGQLRTLVDEELPPLPPRYR